MLTRGRGERGYEAWPSASSATAARIVLARTRTTAAAHYDAATALATVLGMRPLVARCHRLGTLYRRQNGDKAKAHEHLTAAATMYREMGMDFWLAKAEAERGPPQRSSPRTGPVGQLDFSSVEAENGEGRSAQRVEPLAPLPRPPPRARSRPKRLAAF
jgi:hypothetical protein